MAGKVIAIIGQSGRGKTSRAKDIAQKVRKPVFCYDVNREWGAKNVPTMVDFLEQSTKKVNTTIVFEEATVFFDGGRDSKTMKELFVSARHRNNVIILLFHSLADCPNYVIRLCHWVIIFRTADSWTYVKSAFNGIEPLLNAFLNVQKNSEIHDKKNALFYYRDEIRLN